MQRVGRNLVAHQFLDLVGTDGFGDVAEAHRHGAAHLVETQVRHAAAACNSAAAGTARLLVEFNPRVATGVSNLIRYLLEVGVLSCSDRSANASRVLRWSFFTAMLHPTPPCDSCQPQCRISSHLPPHFQVVS